MIVKKLNVKTPRQRREAEEFNRRATDQWKTEVDLYHYDRPKFGPWNPYWTIFDLILRTQDPSVSNLLSFGCGTGSQALRLAAKGYHVSGFDISDVCIGNAKSLASKYGLSEKTSFSVQAAENLDYPDNSFDVVVGENILHHIDLPRALPEINRVLKEGGMAIFKDSTLTPIRDRIRRSWPIRMVLPLGTKNLVTGERYRPTEDESPLGREDLHLLRQQFPQMELFRFHVFALLAKLTGNRPMMEKLDWRIFKVLPVLRRFGDNIVVVLRK